MEELIEFDVVVYLHNDEQQKEIEKYADMGLDISEDQGREERIVKYAFDCSKIVEVRQTFVTYDKKWEDAVVVTYSKDYMETPPLLTTYEEFKRRINEHRGKTNKEIVKVE